MEKVNIIINVAGIVVLAIAAKIVTRLPQGVDLLIDFFRNLDDVRFLR